MVESTRTLREICERYGVNEIYLDMDDVLNHFVGDLGYMMVTTSHNSYDLSWWDFDTGYSILDQFRRLVSKCELYSMFATRVRKATRLEDVIPEYLWRRASPTWYLPTLIDACYSIVGRGAVHIATKPLDQVECYTGKKEWIDTNLKGFRGQVHITTAKYKLAAPGRLLIDDTLENCKFWDSYGGVSLNVPKPWNRRDYKNGDDYDFFNKLLEK